MAQKIKPEYINDVVNQLAQQPPPKRIRDYNCRLISNGIPLVTRNFYWLPAFEMILEARLIDQGLIPNDLMISHQFAVHADELGYTKEANKEQFYLTETGVKFLNLLISKFDSDNPHLRPAYYNFLVKYLTKSNPMTNKLQQADIDKWISEVNKIYPTEFGGHPEIFSLKDTILRITSQCFARKVHEILIDYAMVDANNKPAELLLENHFAMCEFDFGAPEELHEALQNSYLITDRGYEFLMRIVKHELKKGLTKQPNPQYDQVSD